MCCCSVPVQGLLAAILGNGDICIYAVPSLSHIYKLQQQQQEQLQQQEQAQQVAAAAEQAGGVGGFEVVTESAAAAPASSSSSPLALRLQPLVRLQYQQHMLGSLAACCEWLPTAPHDKLLVGCSDGKVNIWKLPLSPGEMKGGC